MAYRADTLNSKDLLALLFLCESERRGAIVGKLTETPEWNEFIEIFNSRIGHMNETGRFEVLEAHLMSVEDIDLYHDETLEALLTKFQPHLPTLIEALEKDPRLVC
jgi:hypothetical protein